MRHYPRPIHHPEPRYATAHTDAEEREVHGLVCAHVLWRALAIALLILTGAAVVVWIAQPPIGWVAVLILALIMALIGMPAWIAGALDTAEDTREDAEYRIELRHQTQSRHRR